ncbi:MAG: FlgO family outer membrane protein [Desulfurivibrionaceae bacterium]
MRKRLIISTLLSLLLLLNGTSPALWAEDGSYKEPYRHYPDQEIENKTENSWLDRLEAIFLPWRVNEKSGTEISSVKDADRAVNSREESLIPHEEGTELKLQVRELASQILADKGGDWGSRDIAVVVNTFVDLNQLYKTSDLGRLLTEQMIGELQKKGIKVIDVRLSNSLQVKEGLGEYGLSREMDELSYVHSAQARLVGTYSAAEDQIVINARLLHQEDGRVLSSGTIILNKNRMITQLLKNSGWPVPERQAVMIESFDKINPAR